MPSTKTEFDRNKDLIEPLKQIYSKAYTEFLNHRDDPNKKVKWIEIKILVSTINMLSDNETLITDDVNFKVTSSIDI